MAVPYGHSQLFGSIEDDFKQRLPVYHKSRRAGIGKHKVLDYGMRWGIEPMFSDFKSRGFGLAQSQIQKPERLELLILIMTMRIFSSAEYCLRVARRMSLMAFVDVVRDHSQHSQKRT